MPACPKCGAQSDDKFCPRCGAPVQPAAASHMQPPVPPYPQQPYQQQPQPPAPYQAQPPQYPQQPQGYPGQPYPGVYPGAMQPQKQGSSWWKWLLGIVGGLLGLFILLIVVAAMFVEDDPAATDDPPAPAATSTATTTTAPGSAAIGPITITTQVDSSSQKPLTAHMATVPASSKSIIAAAQITAKNGQKVTVEWSRNGQKIHTSSLVVDRDIKQIWGSFQIQPAGASWATGNYKAAMYLDGNYATEVQFTVK